MELAQTSLHKPSLYVPELGLASVPGGTPLASNCRSKVRATSSSCIWYKVLNYNLAVASTNETETQTQLCYVVLRVISTNSNQTSGCAPTWFHDHFCLKAQFQAIASRCTLFSTSLRFRCQPENELDKHRASDSMMMIRATN